MLIHKCQHTVFAVELTSKLKVLYIFLQNLVVLNKQPLGLTFSKHIMNKIQLHM